MIFGNGGSAALSQEFAAELMGKFEKIRDPLPAIALTTDSSFITAWSNDVGFDSVFSRQIIALCKKGDVVIGVSTTGHSSNVRMGLFTAKELGGLVIDFPREGKNTADIQEKQHKLMHRICREVELKMFP